MSAPQTFEEWWEANPDQHYRSGEPYWIAEEAFAAGVAGQQARYEAVVEAARTFFEVVDQINARGRSLQPPPLRIVQVQSELRAALAGLDEKAP